MKKIHTAVVVASLTTFPNLEQDGRHDSAACGHVRERPLSEGAKRQENKETKKNLAKCLSGFILVLTFL